VDDGDYKQSWESASSIFKNAITDDQWEQRVAAVREPRCWTRTGSGTCPGTTSNRRLQ
jgi:hypothetical protein